MLVIASMSTAGSKTRTRATTNSSELKRMHERYVEFADALGIEDAHTKTIDELKLIISATAVDFEGLEKLATEIEMEAENLENKAKQMASEVHTLERRVKQAKAKKTNVPAVVETTKTRSSKLKSSV